MNNDFTQPQRQSLVGVVVMFADTLQKFARALFPVLIVLVSQITTIGKGYFVLGLIVIFILIAVIAYLRYRNFTFYLDEENKEFIINEGIFNKSRLAIPLDKIQQVNINQSLLQRIIDVHSLEVDTAGTNKQEVSIKAIPHELAASLKNRLISGGKSDVVLNDEVVPESDAAEKALVKISLASLFKTGITSNYARSFALLLAFVISTFQYIEDYINIAGFDKDPLDEYINAELALRFLSIIIIGVMALVLIVNLGRTIIKYYDYKIIKQHGSLLLSYGLINTRNTILRPGKIQYLTLGRNYFQKRLNVQDLKIRQASGYEAADGEKKKASIEIPGLSSNEKDNLLRLLLGSLPEKGAMLKPNIRKIIAPVFFWLVMPLSIYFGIEYAGDDYIFNYINFVPVYFLAVSIVIYFAYKHSRLYVNEHFIIKQSGAWDIDTDYLQPHKIQSMKLTQYFWQKSADVGKVKLYTAGGAISFGPANYTIQKQFANYWLYRVEKENKGWM
jgi:putative membrane protein